MERIKENVEKTLRPVGVELVTLRQNGINQLERSTTELNQHW